MSDKKILVAYYSASGVTARLAKTIADVTKGVLYEIKPEKEYSSADLNWNNNSSRSSVEMKDQSARPAIRETVDNMGAYDAIFVGFPVWWYEAPRIIQTFLESYDFSGKTVIPFATSGGSGLGNTDSILMKSCSAATNWKPGRKMSSGANAAEIKSWVDGLGL